MAQKEEYHGGANHSWELLRKLREWREEYPDAKFIDCEVEEIPSKGYGPPGLKLVVEFEQKSETTFKMKRCVSCQKETQHKGSKKVYLRCLDCGLESGVKKEPEE